MKIINLNDPETVEKMRAESQKRAAKVYNDAFDKYRRESVGENWACNCVGPQPGEKVCPCRLRATKKD